jgi:tetratricopeptide (TPR) repeat protein
VPRLKSTLSPGAGVAGAGTATTEVPKDWRSRLFDAVEDPVPLTKEEIDHWLATQGTNAASLLALRQAGAGTNYLQEALAQFPDDPRVLFQALALKDSPEARQDRLERFKAAAPDNALPEFLSAREHFRGGQPEEALKDLAAALQKPHFQDYTREAVETTEQLYLSAGRSEAEAKALAMSSALLPQLAQLKSLAQEMATLQQQYTAAGDPESAATLARYGMVLGQHLTSGEGSRSIIGQLVGISIEQILMRQLPQDQPYGFLAGTAAERLASIAARKAEFREGTQQFEPFIRTASEEDIVRYFDRVKTEGEHAANRWMIGQLRGP